MSVHRQPTNANDKIDGNLLTDADFAEIEAFANDSAAALV